MQYKSTRGQSPLLSFEEATLAGLADDGGLYVPAYIPKIDISYFLGDPFEELFYKVMRLFVSTSEVPERCLRGLIAKSFSTFRVKEVVEVVPVSDFYLLELFHGPTFAFKDVALQFLGNLFEYFLKRRDSRMVVVGATSGDTGSAAIYGLRGKSNVEVFILHPLDKVSPIQEKQMTSVLDSNVHNIAIKGSFDDCQGIVKALFNDLKFKQEFHLGAVNSINLVRILSQISYYVYSYTRFLRSRFPHIKSIPTDSLPEVIFSVPTGNSGDILAGFYAKMMGVPIHHLFLCTNQNNTLHKFFETGEYVRSKDIYQTLSPSMDIQISSNIERYLYFVSGDDPNLLREWMHSFEKNGILKLPEKYMSIARKYITSSDVSDEETVKTIYELHNTNKYTVCPHTAIGIKGAKKIIQKHPQFRGVALISLATAHQAKFQDSVLKSMKLHHLPELSFPMPEELNKLWKLPTRKHILDSNVNLVKTFITQNSHLNKSKL